MNAPSLIKTNNGRVNPREDFVFKAQEICIHPRITPHKETGEIQAGATRGLVMNMGWRYNLMVWFCDTFLFRGTLRKLPQRTADLAHLQPGEAVLDVGCGTGALALVVKERVGETGRVRGIDPGPQQITRARSKAERVGLPN